MTLNKFEDYKFFHTVKIKEQHFIAPSMYICQYSILIQCGVFAFHKSFLGWFLSGWLRYFSNYAGWRMVALSRK